MERTRPLWQPTRAERAEAAKIAKSTKPQSALVRKRLAQASLWQMKQCPRCGEVKSLEAFKLETGTKRSYCRDCYNAYDRERRKARPYTLEYKRKQHERYVERVYGADYARLFAEQQGVCAVCGNAEPNGRRLAVDHDHVTGRARALLCQGCNTGIGGMREDTGVLFAAIMYLRKHSQKAA